MGEKMKLENWKTVESRTLLSAPPYLSVCAERVALPDGREVEDFYQIDLAPFVCLFAETDDGKVLVIHQYKHDVRQVSLTFPGKTPLEAARRELREETGFEAGRWLSLGDYVINANQGCGAAHFFVGKNCRQVCQPDSGDLEDMQVMAIHRDEIMAAAKRGEFRLLNQIALFSLATHPDFSATIAVQSG